MAPIDISKTASKSAKMLLVFVRALKYVPKKAYTRVIGVFAKTPLPRPLRSTVYGTFARAVGADLTEAERATNEYRSFQDFFSRRLRTGARTIANSHLVSPVDGQVISAGTVRSGQMLQVKGSPYSLSELLGNDSEATPFEGGPYLTIYLHPRNYHRIHSPAQGHIEASQHLAGTLYPVNESATRQVPRLLAINERLVTYLRTETGRMAVVKVAAMGVGTVQSFYDQEAWGGQGVRRYNPSLTVSRGEEIATFLMGSTVVLVMEPVFSLRPLSPGQPLRLGEPLTTESEQEGTSGPA